MATSERILAPVRDSTNVSHTAITGFVLPHQQPVWRSVVLDLVTILAGLEILDYTARASAIATWLGQPGSPIAIALMLVTIFAFAGAYPRQRTPLNIANTEGLVRGASCIAILVVISSISRYGFLADGSILTTVIVISLLVMQREITNVFFRDSWNGGWSLSAQAQYRFLVNAPPEDCFGRPEAGPSRLLKRAVDIVAAATVLILTLPLGLAIALLIKLDSKGPAFIRQRRIGRRGVSFDMWKFRSMHAGVARYERSPVTDKDPRLTRLGRGLRRLSLDELPQLLNVLKGDMSLVGPRPEMPFIVKGYSAYECLRLEAVPGITGIWQISPARAMPIHQNIELDLFYIEHHNFFLDTAILLRTLTAVIRGIGAR